ncbi:hypothetical protein [Streptomyces sp. YGL11-2]
MGKTDFEDFTKEFGCAWQDNSIGVGTDFAPRAAGHWDCSSAGD